MDFPQQWEIFLHVPIRFVIVVAGQRVVVGVERENHDSAKVVGFHVVRFAFEASLVFVGNPLKAGGEKWRAGFRVVFDAHVEVASLEPTHFGVACKAQNTNASDVIARCANPRVERIHETEGMTVGWKADDDFRPIETFRHPIIDGVIYVQRREKADFT
jgi:hypothetical protein